ncbi:hypothetical protein BGZ73_007151 [Actinomortierella ambigua]|nr:hypothetical protein BGZ73_007151 [Actinomortierella ambigua]
MRRPSVDALHQQQSSQTFDTICCHQEAHHHHHHHPEGHDLISAPRQRIISSIQAFHHSHVQIERLSETDQQEYAEWLEWKRKERSKARERKKRREERKRHRRQLLNLAREQQACIDLLSRRLANLEAKNGEVAEDVSYADYFWSDDENDNVEIERVARDVQKHEAALDKIQAQLAQLENQKVSSTQDDAEDEYFELDDSEDTAYDSAEDETPLMMLMNGFNFLHSFIKPAQPRELHTTSPSPLPRHSSSEDEQDVDKDQGVLDNSVTGDETDMEEADPDVASLSLADRSLRSRSSSASSVSSSSSSLEMTSRPFTFPFAGTLERLRKKQRARERRQRLSELCPLDGLPQALPLLSCGHWIKVINLQQDTPFRHHSSLYPQQYLEPRWRASRMVEQLHGNASAIAAAFPLANNVDNDNHEQEPQRRRRSYLSYLFGHRPISDFDEETIENEEHPDQQQATMQEQQQQETPIHQRFALDADFDFKDTEAHPLTRHDFISDQTLQIILDHCPNLARLTLSECTRITDRGLEMIRDSECVAREQLVSLHLAGCWRITDKGLASLVASVPAASVDDTVSDCREDTAASTASSTAEPSDDLVHLRLESFDIAGCWQVTDQGVTTVLRACGVYLTHLRVSSCELVTGDTVLELAEHCPKIRWLDLARTGPIHDAAIQALATHCHQLEWLTLARAHPDEPSDGSSELGEISDATIGKLCEWCPQLQLLDLSYNHSLTNESIELLSQHATSLVCLTIIGCSGITAQALYALAQLRNTSGKLSCITMGDALGISESDIERIMQGTLSGWQKSSVEETSMSDILGGLSWEDD